ncbi:MAG TPA: hypothetical protein VK694_01615 [Verrucomicrobiae bacterium]|nr:hypothetical protein [Verrucomicrobiae bacterium]
MSTVTLTLNDLDVIPDLQAALLDGTIKGSTSDTPTTLVVVSPDSGEIVEFRFIKLIESDDGPAIRARQLPIGRPDTYTLARFLARYGTVYLRHT